MFLGTFNKILHRRCLLYFLFWLNVLWHVNLWKFFVQRGCVHNADMSILCHPKTPANKNDLQRDRQRCTTHAIPFTLFRGWGGGGVTPCPVSGLVPGLVVQGPIWRGVLPCQVPGLFGECPLSSPRCSGGCPCPVPGPDPPCEQTNWKHYLHHTLCVDGNYLKFSDGRLVWGLNLPAWSKLHETWSM